ncbi:uncharacterized protein Triagg1_1004 [Trichoderma aggressivum f. europaeum]|uniref:Uncharacterized protein n=1 Tax=Trichoderma aggressivum f. europaeum TaxID=173218 RepID=A0AAE1IKI1_9HYPO|nr:hypothetical protein Triagg1_1004 [Trichoderma aggressivum f. europaeum]
MVGAAQYLDEEIDWVLSAVVGKKKQSYIQTHFKDKFGRSLNHNQIRYIKNKYGKDPRFNSPLVNTRAPRIATSPKPGDPGEQEGEDEQGNDIDFGNPREDGPSMKIEKRQNESKDAAVAMIRAKRKRGADDSGSGRSRFIKKIIGPQRPQLQRDRASRTVQYETPPQQWNALDLQPSTSHVHPTTTSLAHDYHDTQYPHTEGYHSTQQPMPSQFHNTGTCVGWTPSVPLTTWETDSPVFTSVNHSMNPSALVYPASTIEQLYHHSAEPTQTLPQTLTIQYQPQLLQPLLAAPSASSFSPLIPNITPYPYQNYREHPYDQTPQRQQDLQLHLEAPENPEYPSLAISEVERHPSLETLSGVPFQLIPSFQEMPIESAFSQGVVAEGDVHERH